MFSQSTPQRNTLRPSGPRNQASDTSVQTVIAMPDASTYINNDIAPSADTIIPYPFPAPAFPVYDGIVQAIAFTKGLFRHKTVRTVELTASGNFVVDIDVPGKVKAYAVGKFRKAKKEFTKMRYTAVTGDPDEFSQLGFSLRQIEMKRTTEIFIVITMYNEDEILFLKTWKSIVKNVSYICARKKSSMWTKDGWKKIVVCIVADGREKIHRRTLTALGLMGVYQEGVIKTSVNSEMVTAHIFEYTSTTLVEQDMTVKEGTTPVQILFCLKEKNAKKINSHRWFFNAFGGVLKPNVCVLIDVGTKPTDRSLYWLWKAFHANPRVGGACGEIVNFEYKISNILDKPLESCFGFISVLPGAFSAYRYTHSSTNASMANMYLAEDRILCFELVSKKNEAWILKYVRSARAETDVPDTIAEFISQRRRWLNGSFFAGVHSLAHFYHIMFRSRHSLVRKWMLMIQTFYNFVNLFALGNFYLVFYFLCASAMETPSSDPFMGQGGFVFIALRQLYLMAIVLVFLSSLGNRPQGSKTLYFLCFLLFSVMMATLLYIVGYQVYQSLPRTAAGWQQYDFFTMDSTVAILFLSIMSTYGLYLVSSVLFLDPWHMGTSFVQYLLMVPSFVNILMVYAFCNLHDISWGTKGDTQQQLDVAPVHTKTTEHGISMATTDLPMNQTDIDAVYERFLKEFLDKPKQIKKLPDLKQAQEDFFRLFRTRVVVFWMASNALLILALTTPQIARHLQVSETGSNNAYLNVLFWSICALSLIRFVGVVVFLFTG
ncbi:glycosyltransferase family 2 protein [Chytridium lagenaria]|nr:glycosyltransferase family 2 protein [Chytridium lagenaria]